jgi:hypothetical protein
MKKLVLFVSALALTATAYAGIPTHTLSDQVMVTGSSVVVSSDYSSWQLQTSCDNIVANSHTVVKASVQRIRTGTTLNIVTDNQTQRCRVTDISEYNDLIASR